MRKLLNTDRLNLHTPSYREFSGKKEEELDTPCVTYGGDSRKVLVRKAKRKRPFGRTKHRNGYNIKRDDKEKRTEIMDCINLVQDTDKWRTLMNEV